VRSFDLSSGACLESRKLEADRCRIGLHPDGRHAWVRAPEGTVRLVALDTGAEALSLPHASAVTSLAVDSAGRFLVSADDDRIARLWDLSRGACVGAFKARDRVRAVAVSPDGHIALGDVAGRVTILRPR
jgi:WD40 repeat protein